VSELKKMYVRARACARGREGREVKLSKMGGESRRERKDMLVFHSTEHEHKIEQELNKCIRKSKETTW
jgi:hypothetical protein